MKFGRSRYTDCRRCVHEGGPYSGPLYSMYPNISRVCRNRRSVQAFLSLKPLAFFRDPPDVTASKLSGRTRYLEFHCGICVDKFM